MLKKFHFFILIFIAAVSAEMSAADWAAVVSEFGAGIAKITVIDDKGAVISQGSGFMIEISQGVERLVTNAHVVRDAEFDSDVSISADFQFSGEENREHNYRLKIDLIDREQDICLLVMEEPAPGILNIDKEDEPGLMEEILVIGYPLGKNFKTTPGYIQAFQDVDRMGRMLDLSAVAAPGNSGGPVLNKKGHVIGIITSIIPGYNFNLAIPVSNLLAVIKNESDSCSVAVNSVPEGAWVFIDGNYKGKTPLTLNLADRKYQLGIEKEGYSVFKDEIGPFDGSSFDLTINMVEIETADPLIEVVVTPPGADVTVNNRSIGKSPVSVRYPAGSIMRIRVSARGYKEELEFYEVTDENIQQIKIKLARKFLW